MPCWEALEERSVFNLYFDLVGSHAMSPDELICEGIHDDPNFFFFFFSLFCCKEFGRDVNVEHGQQFNDRHAGRNGDN